MKIATPNIVLGLAVLAFVIAMALFTMPSASVANEPDVSTRIATSSTMQAGPQEVKTLFSEKRGLCASRIVTTVASPLMLSFSSDITPSGIVGHLQAASTTKEYDSDTYGCGAVTAYGFASSTITKSEFYW